MKNLQIAALLSCSFFLMACPYYESKFPLSTQHYKVDGKLLGHWENCPTEGECMSLLVTRRNDYIYNLTYRGYNASENKWETETFQATLSSMNEDWYLNIRHSTTYRVTKIALYADKVYLYGLNSLAFRDKSGKQVTFESPQDFQNYVAFYEPRSELFLKPDIFVRQ